jgi:large subunit ribosomal protein L10
MNRAEKTKQIEALSDCFTKAQIAVCADPRGLTVAQVTALRREIRAAGGTTKVVKNTLARLSARHALKEKKAGEVDRFVSSLKGPTLIVYSFSDPVGPTKVLAKAAQSFECFKLKGAFLDGAFLGSSDVEALSKMPGREEILGQLLRLINTPATNLVRLIGAPATQVVRVIDAYREKLAAG